VEIAFDNLIKLQDVDSEINAVSSLLEAIPAQIEAIDRNIKATAEILTQAKEKLAANQKKRRDLEGDVKSFKEQIAKFKRQLNDVKTNKEYTALLKEIDEARHKADKIEEDILNEMIAADDIEKDIKAANAKKAEEESRLHKDKDAIFAGQKELEARKSRLLKERDALLPQVPPDKLKLYLQISKRMKGLAMSPVTDDFCSVCQMRVRPQILNDLMEMRQIIVCEACGRILYWQKPKKEDVPEEKSDDPNKVDETVRR
jgi:hypothetical protein